MGQIHPVNFTCDPENSEEVKVTFEDVTFYSDENTTVVACTIPRGTILSKYVGYSIHESFNDDEFSTYQLMGNMDITGCEDAEYFRAKDIEYMPNSFTTYIPFGDYVPN